MNIAKRQRLVHIGVRIPPAIREKVEDIARRENVKPSDVYRTIIGSFFEPTVNKTETKLDTERSIEPA